MIELLKSLATEKLNQAMQANALNGDATSEAAQEGASSIVADIAEKLKGGNLDEIKDLLSGNSENLEQNELFQSLQSKLSGILEQKGLDTNQAAEEAKNTLPNVLSGIAEKFNSTSEEDASFSFEQLTVLLPDNAAGILNKVTGFFKK